MFHKMIPQVNQLVKIDKKNILIAQTKDNHSKFIRFQKVSK